MTSPAPAQPGAPALAPAPASAGSARLRGVLLAAGSSSRFGANKLLHLLADGTPVAVASARNLIAAMPGSIAVVRPGSAPLETLLREAGCEVVVCPNADEGMGVSLAFAIAAAADEPGWLVALADMPFIRVDTIATIARWVGSGAVIAAPVQQGRRGHPVAFCSALRDELLGLRGDEGARGILQRWAPSLHLVAVDDAGVHRDIDTPGDVP